MENLQTQHLHKLFQTASIAEIVILDTNPLSVVDRFAFGAIEKVKKISHGMMFVQPSVDEVENLEFTMGTLLRSLMMDDIQLLALINIEVKLREESKTKEQITYEISEKCYKFLADGTMKLIKNIKNNPELTLRQKNELTIKFANMFPKAFDMTDEINPKLRSGYGPILTTNEYNALGVHDSLVRKDHVFEAFSRYSMYDHLSFWTGQMPGISIETRMNRIKTEIIICLFHMRDLMLLSYNHGETNEKLLPIIEELNTYIQITTPI